MSPGLFILLGAAVVLILFIIAIIGTYAMAHPPRLTAGVALARNMPIDPQQVAAVCRTLTIESNDNKPIELWLLFGAQPEAPCIIGLHGWGDSRYGLLNHAPLLLPLVSHLVLYDQRAHGDSPHRRATGGNAEADDLARVVKALRAAGVAQPIVLLGHSMGGVLAIAQASSLGVCGVIADSAFNDPMDVMTRMLRSMRLPAGLLMGLMLVVMQLFGRRLPKTTTAQFAGAMDVPLLVIHGSSDPLVDLLDAKRIADAAAHGELFIVEGAGHLQGAALDSVGYQEAIARWLKLFSPTAGR